MIENVHKVKLVHHSRAGGANISQRVVFDVTPDVVETRNVNYSNISPIQSPGSFQVFQNTSARSFSVSNIRLISRTRSEASLNYVRLLALKSWTMPYFGSGTEKENSRMSFVDGGNVIQDFGKDFITFNDQLPKIWKYTSTDAFGSPPPVLAFSAYASSAVLGHIRAVPVVLSTISIPYPSDIDFIMTNEGVPMPTIISFDMQLSEARSPNDLSRFSLRAYKEGTLENY